VVASRTSEELDQLARQRQQSRRDTLRQLLVEASTPTPDEPYSD